MYTSVTFTTRENVYDFVPIDENYITMIHI